MKTSSIIVTTLCVSAASVIAATLFAPNKGAKTRKKMAKKGHEYQDYIQDKVEDFIQAVSRPLEDIKDETTRLTKKANAKAKKIKSEAS